MNEQQPITTLAELVAVVQELIDSTGKRVSCEDLQEVIDRVPLSDPPAASAEPSIRQLCRDVVDAWNHQPDGKYDVALGMAVNRLDHSTRKAEGGTREPLLDKVTRLEVIDEQGRAYTRWNCILKFSIQDQGRTLKVLVDESAAAVAPTEEHEP